jgi:hypothetical protein
VVLLEVATCQEVVAVKEIRADGVLAGRAVKLLAVGVTLAPSADADSAPVAATTGTGEAFVGVY